MNISSMRQEFAVGGLRCGARINHVELRGSWYPVSVVATGGIPVGRTGSAGDQAAGVYPLGALELSALASDDTAGVGRLGGDSVIGIHMG